MPIGFSGGYLHTVRLEMLRSMRHLGGTVSNKEAHYVYYVEAPIISVGSQESLRVKTPRDSGFLAH